MSFLRSTVTQPKDMAALAWLFPLLINYRMRVY